MLGLEKYFNLERRLAKRLPPRLRRWALRCDRTVAGLLDRHGITVLRIALAVVFLWFGALKVFGQSPVEDVVRETAFLLPEGVVIAVLGVWEIVIGVGLLIRVALRITLALFLVQMSGTFLTLVVLPDLSFQNGNPLLLSVLGEFVVKNIVLVAAGLVVASTIRRQVSVGNHIDPVSQSEREIL